MIALTTLLIEGRYDSIVTNLSNKILTVFKDSLVSTTDPDGMFAGEQIYFKSKSDAPAINGDSYKHVWFLEVENKEIPLDFYLELRIQWVNGLNISKYTTNHVTGELFNETKDDSDDMPLVSVYITADPNDAPNLYSQVSLLLKDVLRHEIEHMTQSGWNTKPNKYIKSDQARRKKINTGKLPAREYFLLPKEIPAMIQGLYTYAKKSKQPLKDVINQNFNQFNLSDADQELIRKVWRTYIKRLGISQEI